ncbi:hypothetical protein ACOMHN_018292 [Nucella lapillus]
MVETALEADRNSRNKSQLKQQKREAFTEAYRSVNRTVLLQWVQVLQEDFTVLDYPSFPREIFDGEGEFVSTGGAFDWESDW